MDAYESISSRNDRDVRIYARKADERVSAEYRRSILCEAVSMDRFVTTHAFWRDA